jgi:phage terminase large subunit-like protein
MRPAWIFDGSEIDDPLGHGERAVEFLRRLRHPKSNLPKRAFQLDPWQERIVRRIYGPRHPDGSRIVKTCLLLLPRGNRKTSLAAALALLHTIGPEKVPGGEVLSAAADRKQARLAYTEAVNIIRTDKRIDKVVSTQDYRNRLTYSKHGSFYEAISAEAGVQHGRTPGFVLADELHAWPKRDMWDVLKSGLVKVKGSLLVIATTAGRGQENIAHEVYAYARKVAAGEIDDPAFLPVLFEAPRDCDWRDESIWHQVNPGLGCGYPDLEGLRQLAREAENRPGDRESFRQLNLNIWLDHSADPFVDMPIYDQGAGEIDFDSLKDLPCWLAVDLSSTTDLTAIVGCWRTADGGYIVKPHFYCPGDNLRTRSERDGVPYVMWAADGNITATSGNVIDYRYVEDQVRELCDVYDVQEVAFDPWGARQIIQSLLADGLPAVEMRQGWVSMGPAIKELERAIISGKFQHGGHPVLRWNFSNVAVETDKSGAKTFHKGKSTDRIDGAQASAMAVGRAHLGGSNRSIYSDTNTRPAGLLFI